jgi:hypothetical protein
MRIAHKILTLAALVGLLAFSTAAFADKLDFSYLLPEQIEQAIKMERTAYKETMAKLNALENSGKDKNSPAYKAEFDELVRAAEEHRVNQDMMREALKDQKRNYQGK